MLKAEAVKDSRESNELKPGEIGRIQFKMEDYIQLERTTWVHPKGLADRTEPLPEPYYTRHISICSKFIGDSNNRDPSIVGTNASYTSIQEAAAYVTAEMKKHPKPQGKDIGDGYGYAFSLNAQSPSYQGGNRVLMNRERQELLAALPHTTTSKQEQIAIQIRGNTQKTAADAKRVAGLPTATIPQPESINWNATIHFLEVEEKGVILEYMRAALGRAERVLESIERAQLPAEKLKHPTELNAISVNAVMARVNQFIETRQLDNAIKLSGKFSDNARALFWCRMLVK